MQPARSYFECLRKQKGKPIVEPSTGTGFGFSYRLKNIETPKILRRRL